MAIARLPKRNLAANNEPKAKSFIAGAGKYDDDDLTKVPVQLRFRSDILERIDTAAKRRGITRTAFITSSVVEKLESME